MREDTISIFLGSLSLKKINKVFTKMLIKKIFNGKNGFVGMVLKMSLSFRDTC